MRLEEESIFGNVIYSYTRAHAIADGVLVDVTKTAKSVGFKWLVAITRSAWEDCIAWSDKDSDQQTHQDESGRLWDVLWMAFVAIRKSGSKQQLIYKLYRVPRDGKSAKAELTKLKLSAGPGDAAEPVLTIMQPNKD